MRSPILNCELSCLKGEMRSPWRGVLIILLRMVYEGSHHDALAKLCAVNERGASLFPSFPSHARRRCLTASTRRVTRILREAGGA
jgi:hypothetical protein